MQLPLAFKTKSDSEVSLEMELQLVEDGSSPDQNSLSQRKLDKDAAVLARFGKRPQLRVCVSVTILRQLQRNLSDNIYL